MKKIVLLTLTVLFSGSLSFAQNSKSFYKSSYESRNSGSFNKSTSLISISYGAPNEPTFGYSYGGYGLSRLAFGPVYGKYEHGFLRDEVGLGGQIAFSLGRVKYGSDVNHINAFSIGVVGYYHFNKLIPIEALDVFAGFGLTVRSVSYTYDSNSNFGYNNTDTNVYPSFKVGARYYVKPKLGIFGEVGYDNMSAIDLGVTFRL